MATIYNFSVKVKLPKTNGYVTYNTTAENIVHAKNKIKEKFPEAKIISCVKGSKKVDRQCKQDKKDSNSGKNMLIGATLTAGLGIMAAIFSKKDNNS